MSGRDMINSLFSAYKIYEYKSYITVWFEFTYCITFYLDSNDNVTSIRIE